MFKLALMQRKYDAVISMIKGSSLCGQAIISYLQQKGFPEVALHFVKDERTRFNLALQCGNIEVALQSAQELDDKDTWYELGVEALRQGNHQIVEFSYQKTKSFERLSFLYLITGSLDKLRKMLKIAEMRGDVMGRFHNALYLGDVREQVRILEGAGQLPLAYVGAATHGLTEDAERIAAALGEDALPELPASAKLLVPPTPILKEDNWPLLTVNKGFFETLAAKDAVTSGTAAVAGMGELDADALEGAGWGDDELDLGLGGGDGEGLPGGDDEDEEGGWDMEDLELPPEVVAEAAAASALGSAGPFMAPAPGIPASQKWLEKRTQLAADHVAAGSFLSAMSLLHRQLGVTNFAPLKQYFMDMYTASHAAVPGLQGLPSMVTHLERTHNPDVSTAPPSAPTLLYSLPQLEDWLKSSYKLVTEGKFADALKSFTRVLHTIPLTVVETRKEVDDVKELISICKEYIIALRCEIARKEVKDLSEVGRILELAAFFTHCRLQPMHLALALRSAYTLFFKHKNLATCMSFCRRLLELNPGAKIAEQARQVLTACEKTPTDALKINYDPRNPFDICCITFTPIYKGSKSVEDAYTGARFTPECEGKISPLGDFVKIGADASGLLISPTQASPGIPMTLGHSHARLAQAACPGPHHRHAPIRAVSGFCPPHESSHPHLHPTTRKRDLVVASISNWSNGSSTGGPSGSGGGEPPFVGEMDIGQRLLMEQMALLQRQVMEMSNLVTQTRQENSALKQQVAGLISQVKELHELSDSRSMLGDPLSDRGRWIAPPRNQRPMSQRGRAPQNTDGSPPKAPPAPDSQSRLTPSDYTPPHPAANSQPIATPADYPPQPPPADSQSRLALNDEPQPPPAPSSQPGTSANDNSLAESSTISLGTGFVGEEEVGHEEVGLGEVVQEKPPRKHFYPSSDVSPNDMAWPQGVPPSGVVSPQSVSPSGAASRQSIPPGGLASPQSVSPSGVASLQTIRTRLQLERAGMGLELGPQQPISSVDSSMVADILANLPVGEDMDFPTLAQVVEDSYAITGFAPTDLTTLFLTSINSEERLTQAARALLTLSREPEAYSLVPQESSSSGRSSRSPKSAGSSTAKPSQASRPPLSHTGDSYLQTHVAQDVLHELVANTRPLLSSACPASLCATMLVLAAAGFRPPQNVLGELVGHAAAGTAASSAAAQLVPELLQALVTFGVVLTEQLSQRITEAHAMGPATTYGDAVAVMLSCWARTPPAELDAEKVASLASTLGSLAVLMESRGMMKQSVVSDIKATLESALSSRLPLPPLVPLPPVDGGGDGDEGSADEESMAPILLALLHGCAALGLKPSSGWAHSSAQELRPYLPLLPLASSPAAIGCSLLPKSSAPTFPFPTPGLKPSSDWVHYCLPKSAPPLLPLIPLASSPAAIGCSLLPKSSAPTFPFLRPLSCPKP
eukprot:gene24536-10140_t